jgi:hypothetical protein
MDALTARQSGIGNARFLLESAATDNKNTRSRMAKYIAWLGGDKANEFARNWLQPDLAAWRDALIEQGKAPATVNAYLSSVRGAYIRVIDDPRFRDLLYE